MTGEYDRWPGTDNGRVKNAGAEALPLQRQRLLLDGGLFGREDGAGAGRFAGLVEGYAVEAF